MRQRSLASSTKRANVMSHCGLLSSNPSVMNPCRKRSQNTSRTNSASSALSRNRESAQGRGPWAVKAHSSPPGLCSSPIQAAWVRAKEKIEQFLVVSPQLAQDRQWDANLDAGWVWAEVQRACGLYGNDGRFFLTGFSYGGGGVLKFAAQNRERWTALWVVDPNSDDAAIPAANGPRVLLHHGGHFSALNPRASGMRSKHTPPGKLNKPIENWKQNTNPAWVDVAGLQAAGQPWWQMQGADRAVRSFNNLEHAATCIAAYLDPDAYD